MGKRGGGRDFTKIIHYYEPWIDDKRHKVAIKMEVDGDGQIHFFTSHFKDDGDRPIDQKFKILSELYDHIEEMLAALPDVVWEPKIYIKVDGKAKGSVDGTAYWAGIDLVSANIDIQAKAIELGTAPDGRRWSRAPGETKRVEKFTKNIGYGFEKDQYWWKEDDPDDPGVPYSRALIDDTPENRELLVQFTVKFDQLRDQFFRAFAPEHVNKFLAQTAGTLLLNSGIDDEAEI